MRTNTANSRRAKALRVVLALALAAAPAVADTGPCPEASAWPAALPRLATAPGLAAAPRFSEARAIDACAATRAESGAALPTAVRARLNLWVERAPPAPGSELRASTSGVWEGVLVPIRALDGSLRLLTPNVGRVALVLSDGERVEGRLLALGDGRVWIDARGVRIALEAARVAAIEQLGDDPAPPNSPRSAPRLVRGLGGALCGAFRSGGLEEGGAPAWVTDGGARLALEPAEARALATVHPEK